jgi:hypothetical protein
MNAAFCYHPARRFIWEKYEHIYLYQSGRNYTIAGVYLQHTEE